MKRGLIADPSDNVGVVLETVYPGDSVDFGMVRVTAAAEIHVPGKMALVPISAEAPVRKFGGIIGLASRPIQAGEWVHSHNLHSAAKEPIV